MSGSVQRPAAADNAGDPVAEFLYYLSDQGYRIGPREFIHAQTLMLGLTAARARPQDLAARLALLRPLVSRTPDQQRRFAELLEKWAPAHGGIAAPAAKVRRRVAQRTGRRRVAALGLAGFVLLIGLLTWIAHVTVPVPEAPPVVQPADTPVDGGAAATAVSASASGAASVPPLPVIAPAPHPMRHLVRAWMDRAGWISGLILAAMLAAYALRRAALQNLMTDAQLDQRTLFGSQVELLSRRQPLLRLVARELRRPRHTERQELELGATIAASVRAGGAFVARYRLRRGTPEYLLLIDRQGPHDQLARVAEEIALVLEHQGVALDVWRYQGDPTRCTNYRLPRGKRAPGDAPGRRLRLAELATRHSGGRLLMFGDASSLLDPLKGDLRDGLKCLSTFAGCVLFTPLPVPSWGAAERWLAARGILVLPLQLLALASAAEWLTAQRALLTLDPQWPATYPPRLRDGGALWVARQAAPPAPEIAGLLFELELYLGTARLQWLCACAVFPVPSWPLTLALAPLFVSGGDAVVVGAAALAALPWFRAGTWPDWLRAALQERLDPSRRAAVNAEIRRRIDDASLGKAAAGADQLAEVALEPGLGSRLRARWRRFRSDTWLARHRGRLPRDLLFMGFLQRGVAHKLTQILPQRLRRMLFHEGLPLMGLRGWLPACALLVAAAGLALQVPALRERVEAGLIAPQYGSLDLVMEIGADLPAGLGLAYSLDGRLIASGGRDRKLRVWDAASGKLMHTVDDWDGRPGNFSFGPGRRLAYADARGGVTIWPADGSAPVSFPAALVQNQPVTAIAFRPDMAMLAVVSDSGDVNLISTSERRSLGLTRPAEKYAEVEFLSGGKWLALKRASGELDLKDIAKLRSDAPLIPAQLLEGGAVVAACCDGACFLVRNRGAAAPLRLWNAGTKSFLPGQFETGGERLADMHFRSPAGDVAGVSGADKLKIWQSGAVPSAEISGDWGRINAWALNPAAAQLAIASADGKVRIWGAALAPEAPPPEGAKPKLEPGAAPPPAATASGGAKAPQAQPPAALLKNMPDLRGQIESRSAALQRVRKLKVPVETVAASEDDFCPGTIVAQQPAPGQAVPAGQSVKLQVARNQTQFYPLVCRGGFKVSDMATVAGAKDGLLRIEFATLAGTAPAAAGLLPRQCAWLDRAFRPGEPVRLQMEIPPLDWKIWGVTAISPDAYFTVQAVNRGAVMRAGCIAPAKAPGPALAPDAGADQAANQTGGAVQTAPSQTTRSAAEQPAADPADAGLPELVNQFYGTYRAPAIMENNLVGAQRLTRVMRDAGLAKADLLALALAIVKLDSGDFRLREEAPNQFNTDPGAEAFNRYENRKDLGNVEAGDGARYKGRGYLQITGRAAYSRLGQALGLGEQLVQKPELALDPVIASRVLAQFIAERQAELSKNIAAGDFRAVSRTLFGGISQTARLTELIKAAQPLAQALLSAPTAR